MFPKGRKETYTTGGALDLLVQMYMSQHVRITCTHVLVSMYVCYRGSLLCLSSCLHRSLTYMYQENRFILHVDVTNTAISSVDTGIIFLIESLQDFMTWRHAWYYIVCV